MKRFAALTVVSFALVGIVAVAAPRSEETSGPGETWEESKTGYADKINAQLEEWEGQLDEFRRQERQYDSISSYMVMDDLELLMKDVRGDLLRLTDSQAQKGDPRWEALRSGIEMKMAELRNNVTQVSRPDVGRTALNKE